MFSELNKVRKTVKEGIETRDLEFKKLHEFAGQTIEVDGFFFSTAGDYGKSVAVVGNGYNINMPQRAVEQFEQIANDEKMLQAVLDGKLVIKNIVANVKTPKGKTTAYELADK